MKVQTKGVSTKEQRRLQRLEYALRLARNHGKGRVYLTDEGLERIGEIVFYDYEAAGKRAYERVKK